jgi:hypothetical protein
MPAPVPRMRASVDHQRTALDAPVFLPADLFDGVDPAQREPLDREHGADGARREAEAHVGARRRRRITCQTTKTTLMPKPDLVGQGNRGNQHESGYGGKSRARPC